MALPPSGTPLQLGFFPRKVLSVLPRAEETADYLGEVEADDGHHYYLKSDTAGRPIRASEWLGTFLAEIVGIAAPSCTIVQLLTGELVFGSRRINGVADRVTTWSCLTQPSLTNAPDRIIGLQAILSSIYAFDLFVFNDDRHFGNYLSVDDNGVRRFFAYDFSRAVFWRWPWTGVPALDQHTRTCGMVIRRMHGFDLAAAKSVLDRLGAISPQLIEAELQRVPADWLAPALKEQFIAWWGSDAKTDRVNEIKMGVENGTYL